MATFQFFNGLDALNQPAAQTVEIIHTESIVKFLEDLAGQWQAAAEEDNISIYECKASVGLMLRDFGDFLGLDDQQLNEIIG
jgi:hypothetical protein